jgi:hypothetical protein
VSAGSYPVLRGEAVLAFELQRRERINE